MKVKKKKKKNFRLPLFQLHQDFDTLMVLPLIWLCYHISDCATNNKQTKGNAMSKDWFIKIVFRSLNENKRLIFRRRYAALTFAEARAIVDGAVNMNGKDYDVVSIDLQHVA